MSSDARLLIMAGDVREVHTFLDGLPPVLRRRTGGDVWHYIHNVDRARGFCGELYAIKIGRWQMNPESNELTAALDNCMVTWVEPEDVADLPIFAEA